jgi:hypothetical protein
MTVNDISLMILVALFKPENSNTRKNIAIDKYYATILKQKLLSA